MSENTKESKTAGGVVVNKDGMILVVSQNNNSWSLPKGHIEEGESALETAKREIYEESGVSQLEYIADLGSYQRYKMGLNLSDDTSELKIMTIFLFKTDQMQIKPIDPGNPEARWVEVSEVANLLTHREDKEFFLSIINKINQ